MSEKRESWSPRTVPVVRSLFRLLYVWQWPTTIGRGCKALWRRYFDHKVPVAAAAIAFFSLMSFAPLVLLTAAICSKVVGDSDIAREKIQLYLEQFLPLSEEELHDVVGGLTSTSLPIGGLGFVMLLWASTAAYNLTYEAICHAGDIPAPFVRRRLMSVAVVLSLALLILVGFFVSSSAPLSRVAALASTRPVAWLTSAEGPAAHAAAVALILLLIYKSVAGSRLAWRYALVAAVVCAPLWELVKWGFWNIAADTLHQGAVYGSLTVIIVVLLWVFYTAAILVVGAELAFLLQNRDYLPEDVET